METLDLKYAVVNKSTITGYAIKDFEVPFWKFWQWRAYQLGGWRQPRRNRRCGTLVATAEGLGYIPTDPEKAKLQQPDRCPTDTNGDGDCHLCHGKPGGCSFKRPHTADMIFFKVSAKPTAKAEDLRALLEAS